MNDAKPLDPKSLPANPKRRIAAGILTSILVTPFLAGIGLAISSGAITTPFAILGTAIAVSLLFAVPAHFFVGHRAPCILPAGTSRRTSTIGKVASTEYSVPTTAFRGAVQRCCPFSRIEVDQIGGGGLRKSLQVVLRQSLNGNAGGVDLSGLRRSVVALAPAELDVICLANKAKVSL